MNYATATPTGYFDLGQTWTWMMMMTTVMVVMMMMMMMMIGRTSVNLSDFSALCHSSKTACILLGLS